VECDEESNGFCGKSDGNEGGRRLTATRAMAAVTATTWLMAMVTRLAGDEEGKGEGGKGDGDGDEVMRVAGDKVAMATAARAMATVTMVAGERW